LESILDATPGLNKLLGAALQELLQLLHIPEALFVYTISYCSENRPVDGSLNRRCYTAVPPTVDAFAILQIIVRVLYIISAVSSIVAYAIQVKNYTRWSQKEGARTCISLWVGIALCAVILATGLAILQPGVLYIVLFKILPLPASSFKFEMGFRFLGLTLAAVIGNVLALFSRRL
jgi:hypothetical protein